MQNVKLAWLAGILDGEGCFSIFHRTNRSKNGNLIITPSASITITNSNLAVIDECINLLNNLGIKFVLKNPRNSTTRVLERLDIRNYTSIMNLIDVLLPFLIGKNEQASLMREFVYKASHRLGFRGTKEREEYLVKISELNKSGQVIRRDYTPNPDGPAHRDNIWEDIVRHSQ